MASIVYLICSRFLINLTGARLGGLRAGFPFPTRLDKDIPELSLRATLLCKLDFVPLRWTLEGSV